MNVPWAGRHPTAGESSRLAAHAQMPSTPIDILPGFTDAHPHHQQQQQQQHKRLNHPGPGSPATRLAQLARHSLEHDLARPAVFYAERLHALTRGSHDARHLLAKALFAAGQVNSAMGVVGAEGMCWACCQIYARCAERLRKYRVAREMMERCLQLVADGHASGVGTLEEATMHCQAGQYAMKGNLYDKAVASLKEALRLNPYLWEAFEMLGSLGSFPDPAEVFPSKKSQGRPAVKRARGRPGAPTASVSNLAELGEKKKTGATKITTRSTSASENTAGGVARRSTRLLSGLGKGMPSKVNATRERKRSAPKRTGSDMDEDVHPTNLPPPPASPTPSSPGRADTDAADVYIMDLVRTFARATQALAQYRSADVLEELEALPEEQKRSASVMVLIGRAEYERADYVKARRAFELARTLDPHRIWDMEIFSTLLWHLRSDVELSFLAQELLALDQRAPQTWIAVGNAFSLQKEHEQALTAFKRAVTLDPHYAYAHTLIGHENVSMEEYDKAASSFQSALRVDRRHYNAW
ncbi:anaphase-promoting complex subunit cdc27 [Ceratobasidium sp. UAMH 11750]|nr:anaphase-promoting complex subunit cdc27 [Ceratobasidium sp. UAMH 11750]